MRKGILSLLLLIGTVAAVFGQSTIAYFNGPSFQVPAFEFSKALDLNLDGVADFNFAGSTPICTTDIPVSACLWRFSVDGNGTNQLLSGPFAIGPVRVQPFGTWISSNPPSSAVWSDPPNGATLLLSFLSYPLVPYGLAPLGYVGIGYLGVRFHAADGLHYGWIRVRLPRSDAGMDNSIIEFTPVVMEWAYETRPDMPIRAGATGLENESSEFSVDFRNEDGSPNGIDGNFGTGRIQLVGNSIHYELRVVGSYQSADLRGPSPLRSNAKPVLSLAHPRIDFRFFSVHLIDPNTVQIIEKTASVFFGEVPLSHSQIIQLKRGAYHVSVGDGAVIGRVVPAAP